MVPSIICTWVKFGTARPPSQTWPPRSRQLGRRALVGGVTKNPMFTLSELPEFSVERADPSRCTTVSAGLYGRVARQKLLVRQKIDLV